MKQRADGEKNATTLLKPRLLFKAFRAMTARTQVPDSFVGSGFDTRQAVFDK